jgi:hypothetical protein
MTMSLYPRIETSHLSNQLRGLDSKNWYVHGADGNDSSPGDRPEKPLATLQEALDRSTAAAYDTIFVTRGVVTGEVTPFVLDKANIRIVGDPRAVPSQSTNCAVIATDDTDCFTFSASDVSIEGFALYAGATSAGVGFAEVAWSQRNLIERCAFVVGGYGIYADNIIDSPGHHLTIQDNLFMGSMGALGGIHMQSNGSWYLYQRNHFDMVAGVNLFCGGRGNSAGRILNNTFIIPTDTEGLAINLNANMSRYLVMDNFANLNTLAVGAQNPFLDAGTTNVWVRNVEGGSAGFTDAAPV